MKKPLGVLVRIAWVVICLVALVNALKGYRGTSDWQMEEGLAFQMIVLSFPALVYRCRGIGPDRNDAQPVWSSAAIVQQS
jgi:hypothetical protein